MSETAGRYVGLSKILREIAEASSLDAALALAAARGGTLIHVPLQAHDSHWLVGCMGRAGADALCRLYPGEKLIIPADPRKGQHARVRAIRRGIAQQMSVDAIALATGVTRRQVFWHKAKLRVRGDRGAQKDLFGDGE